MKQKIRAVFLIIVLIMCQMSQTVIAAGEEVSTSFLGVLISDTDGNINTGGGYVLDYPGNEYGTETHNSASNNFIEDGTTVTLIAVPDDDHLFKGWYQGEPDPAEGGLRFVGEPFETDYTYEFTAPIGLERPYICAVFVDKTKVHLGDQLIVYTADIDGSLKSAGGKVAVLYTPSWDDWPDIVSKDGTDFKSGEILPFYQGDECTVYARPEDGYKFVGWYRIIETESGETFSDDALSTDSNFTYKPGVTIVAGDTEPLHSICAVFEEDAAETCTVSFDPGTGTGSMLPATVNAGEVYTLPACTFTHTNAERTFAAWSVNGVHYSAGEDITINTDTEVIALWKYTKSLRDDKSVDNSTTFIMGAVALTDTWTGTEHNESVYAAIEIPSTFTEPYSTDVYAAIDTGKEALSKKAQELAGGNTLTIVDETVSDPQIVETGDNRHPATTYDNTDENGDLYTLITVSGDYYHIWRIDMKLTAEYSSHVHTLVPTAEVPATCTRKGTAAYWTCSECGKMFSDEAGTTQITKPTEIPALGHKWGDWTVTKPATVSEEGEETRTCKNDPKHKETRKIPKLEETDIGKGSAATKSRSYVYTGSPRKPDPVIKLGGKTLKKGTDYVLSYKSNRDVGTATVTAKGTGKYKGTISCTFKITARNISDGTASTKWASYPYTGKNRRPAMILKVNSRTLVKNVDYTLTYKNNKNVGTGTVTAHGIGNYTGTKSCTFKIVAKQKAIIPVYRLFNTKTGEHFYTTSVAERQSCLNAGNWNSEGIAWYAPEKSDEPIYRLLNPSNRTEHHYTKSKNEAQWLVSMGWIYEGIAWYSDTDKTIPVYRHYHPKQITGNHHYTTSKGESDHIIEYEGWRYEGISFYVSKAGG